MNSDLNYGLANILGYPGFSASEASIRAAARKFLCFS